MKYDNNKKRISISRNENWPRNGSTGRSFGQRPLNLAVARKSLNIDIAGKEDKFSVSQKRKRSEEYANLKISLSSSYKGLVLGLQRGCGAAKKDLDQVSWSEMERGFCKMGHF